MLQAMTHLKKLGHRKVIYLHRKINNFCSRNRRQAFCEIAKTLGNVVWQTQEICITNENRDEFMDFIFSIMQKGFSAVIIEGETGSIFACNHLCRAGIKIPEELSIIGWDSPGLSNYTIPALTAIGQNFTALAEAAVNTLNTIWDGGTPQLIQEFPYLFFERESTGTFAAEKHSSK